METRIEELRDWYDGARRGLQRQAEELREREEQIDRYLRALDAMDALLAKLDDLKEELEQRQSEIDDLTEQLDEKNRDIDALRLQLVEVKEQKLKVEEERADGHPKPPEIHNHFESGSSAQVFNDKVTGRFEKAKRQEKLQRKDKKEKKKWKKIVRKML